MQDFFAKADRCSPVSAQSPRPTVGEKVQSLLDDSVTSDDTVELLVGLRDDRAVDPDRELESLLDGLDASVSEDLGFGIYEVTVPIEEIEVLAKTSIFEYIEYPDPDGAPGLMGN